MVPTGRRIASVQQNWGGASGGGATVCVTPDARSRVVRGPTGRNVAPPAALAAATDRLLVLSVHRRSDAWAAIAAAAVVLPALALPHKLGLLVAAVVGIAATAVVLKSTAPAAAVPAADPPRADATTGAPTGAVFRLRRFVGR